MNEIPTPNGGPDEVDDRYRRLSDRDPNGPSEAARRAVLRHAAELAAQMRTDESSAGTVRPAAKISRWRVASYGGLAAAAALAGLLIAPHFLTPPPPPVARQSMVPPSAEPAAPTAAREADAESAPQTSRLEQDRVAGARRPLPQAQAIASAAAAASPRALAPAHAAAVGTPVASLREVPRRGEVPALQRLLAQKLDVDARDASGQTALMLAVRAGRKEAVNALLAAGADPNAADSSGAMPLQVALAGGHSAIATALEQSGAR
jgi:Ankyrin repeats (many copies)